MMSRPDLLLEKTDGCGILTINRPDALNAITAEMLFEGFNDCFERAHKDEDINVLILTGAGRAFCSGLDLSAFESLTKPASRFEFSQLYGDWALTLRSFTKPIIAAVNGAAMGGGLTLALLSDVRIASENAKFSSIWIKRGIIPDCSTTYFLPRIVGFPRALEMMLTGEIIDAREAEKIGLVKKVVPADKLMEEAMSIARSFAEGPSLAIGLCRQAAYASLDSSLEQQMHLEMLSVKSLLSTHDCRESINAFFEKRKPRFIGK